MTEHIKRRRVKEKPGFLDTLKDLVLNTVKSGTASKAGEAISNAKNRIDSAVNKATGTLEDKKKLKKKENQL